MNRSILIGLAALITSVAALTQSWSQDPVIVTNVVTRGTLSTWSGAPILDVELSRWIDRYIPTNAAKLLVMTQCYSGDIATAFEGKTNTVVLSGGSPGQQTFYGGYDAGAARGMRPGPGRTAQHIHDSGVANRDRRETPTTGGGMSPGDFPMESVTTNGTVRSRHVIWFAGQPDHRPGRDLAQDLMLQEIFGRESNTTYWAAAATTAFSRGLAIGHPRGKRFAATTNGLD